MPKRHKLTRPSALYLLDVFTMADGGQDLARLVDRIGELEEMAGRGNSQALLELRGLDERAVVDMRMAVDGRPVAAVEHEAIVSLH